MAETFIVPKISDGPASADTFNTPLEYIEDALNTIQAGLQDFSQKDAVLQWEAPVAADVTAGDLVYFNKDAGNFQKAFAEASRYQNQLREADSCHVEGLVLSVDTTQNSATLLRSGYYISGVVTGAIGVGASAGTWYLSTTPGKATQTPGWEIRIPVISYYGDSKFSFIAGSCPHVGSSEIPVRRIISNTLNVYSDSGSGTVEIEHKDYVTTSPEASAYAVSGISGSNLLLTPIASMLMGGAGIKTSYRGSGVWSVSLDSLIDKPLTASDFTLNGSQRVADNLLTYTVFPAGSQTSMVMTMPLDFISSTPFTGKIKAWATTRGPGAGSYAVQLYWLPYSSSAVTIADSGFGSTTLFTNNTSTDRLIYYETDEVNSPVISGPGALVARFTASSPTYDMYIHEAGFKLLLEESSDSSSGTSDVTREQIMAVLSEVLSFNPNYSE